jgi:GDP-L-fucose synthase
LDLRNQENVNKFFAREQPEYVFLAAAKVGGIQANRIKPAEFIYDNLLIEANIIHASYIVGVKKLVFLGSSCIYPKFCPQPIKEEYLLTGQLEYTNKSYAIAKIAGIELCNSYRQQYGANFISCMPTNLYGPYDTFDTEHSHVIPALIKKIHEAKITGASSVRVWGSGRPRREFLFVEDLAEALIFLMQKYNENSHINIGTGTDITIADLISMLQKIIGYEGSIAFDTTYPEGTPQKLLDTTKINILGWKAKTDLFEGLQKTYAWFSSTHHASLSRQLQNSTQIR